MRRPRLAALSVPALVLVGCSTEQTPSAPTTPDGVSASTERPASDSAGGGQTATEAPADGQGATATAAPGVVADGQDGQAAADVAAAFLVAMVNAEPEACDYLLSFTDPERPMTAVESDYEMCVELLPEILRAETEAQGVDEDVVAELEGLVIEGAEVDGDTAVIDQDNYPPDLALSMGNAAMTLKQIGGQWYVDLDSSFAVPTAP